MNILTSLKKTAVWITLVCFIITITGCVTTPETIQKKYDVGLPNADRNGFALTIDEQSNANQASNIFNSSPNNDKPLMYDPDRKKEAKQLKKQLAAVTKKYKNKKQKLTATESQEVTDASLPFVNYMIAVEQSQKGLLVVPPGERRSITMGAFFMDKKFSAPTKDEKFHLIKTDSILPSKLQPVYQDMMKYAQNHQDEANREDLQGIVWVIREVANQHNVNGKLALSDHQMEILSKASPNAVNALLGYQQSIQSAAQEVKATDDALNELGSIIGKVANAYNIPLSKNAAKSAIQGDFSGAATQVTNATVTKLGGYQFANLFNTVTQDTARNDVRTTMANIQKTPVTGVTSPNGEYTLLAPKVAARTSSPHGGASDALVEISNTSESPYSFDTAQYVAQSQRQVQRLGFYPNQIGEGINAFDYGMASSFLAK